MRTKSFLAGCLAVAASTMSIPALAGPGDHHWEATLGYERRMFDEIVFPDIPGFPGTGGTFDPPDNDVWRASGRYYFQDVKTDDVPLSEAAYLGRNSSAMLSASRFDADIVELNGQELGFELYVPKSMFYFAGGIARFETAAFINSSGVIEGDHTDWYGVFGITPLDGLRITTFYGHDSGYDPNVNVKYVGKIRDSHFYGASVRVIDPDQGDLSIGANFDFYFDLTLKAGVGYEEAGDRWSLAAEKFFTPRASVGASLFEDDGGDGFRIEGSYRF